MGLQLTTKVSRQLELVDAQIVEGKVPAKFGLLFKVLLDTRVLHSPVQLEPEGLRRADVFQGFWGGDNGQGVQSLEIGVQVQTINHLSADRLSARLILCFLFQNAFSYADASNSKMLTGSMTDGVAKLALGMLR